MKNRVLLLVVAGLAGAAGGWLFTEQVLKKDVSQAPTTSPQASDLIGQRRPDFSIGSTTGEVITAAHFDGHVTLINFWATWCAPCREEMPMLSALHERLNGRGFQVVGVALDDVQQARDFLDDLNIRYTNMVGGADVMAMGAMYGNRAGLLPYSVLVDRQGIVRWYSLGELKAPELEQEIQPLL